MQGIKKTVDYCSICLSKKFEPWLPKLRVPWTQVQSIYKNASPEIYRLDKAFKSVNYDALADRGQLEIIGKLLKMIDENGLNFLSVRFVCRKRWTDSPFEIVLYRNFRCSGWLKSDFSCVMWKSVIHGWSSMRKQDSVAASFCRTVWDAEDSSVRSNNRYECARAPDIWNLQSRLWLINSFSQQRKRAYRSILKKSWTLTERGSERSASTNRLVEHILPSTAYCMVTRSFVVMPVRVASYGNVNS